MMKTATVLVCAAAALCVGATADRQAPLPHARIAQMVEGDDWWLPLHVKLTPYSGYVSWSPEWSAERGRLERFRDGNLHFAVFLPLKWSGLNPAEGVYNWESLDRNVERVISVPGTGFMFWTYNYAEFDISPFALVVLHTDEGMEGVGEANGTAAWSGETQQGCIAIIEQSFKPLLLERAPFDWEALMDALAVLRHRAADIISVYPGKNGGIWKAKQIAHLAAQEGVACHVGSNLEWDIGSAAMAHLAVSTPNIRSDLYPADIIGPLHHADRVVQNPLHIEPGFVEVPEGMGLGVELKRSR